ncbi:sulfatase-like hydrolase/transferase [Verrucomicrobiaceae bacterium N1E253]|uniref:Sulfatase-like hydrolase/transferase n=1 Tax=Oceaniferula marina TaxID=2748318 RepID=A0A851GI47_9BACT|nr:sulfatase-like hydrolase/transferase [Oceaniferula marina]NWK54300.1 sulfatase-like hydrolase/transferase [Oceaniferula marina]
MKLLIALSSILFALQVMAADKPNVILIMADDLGYADLSCYGSQLIETPVLDKLATGGVRCTDFHSNGAVCSPTRAALITGRYQQRSGVTGVITAKSHRHAGLATNEWTVAEAMKSLGYRTAMFGKWHLGYQAKFNPVKQGFDEFRGFVSGNVDYHRHIDQEGYADWWVQDELKDEPGYITDLISQHGVDFIKRNKDRPFFLMLTHGAPHYPLQGRKTPGHRVVGKPHGKQPRQVLENPQAIYKEMVEVMDEGIGKLVTELERLQIRKNTLIVFCSDNGPARSGSAGVLKGKKGSIWEGGHRVCGIFNWPEHLEQGQTCHQTMMTMDLFPTFVSLAGGKVEDKRELDGVDILPALQGKPLAPRTLFWSTGRGVAVRQGDFKLVLDKKKVLLYNLKQDVGEQSDLSKTKPEQTQKLLSLLKDWKRDVAQDSSSKMKPK